MSTGMYKIYIVSIVQKHSHWYNNIILVRYGNISHQWTYTEVFNPAADDPQYCIFSISIS